MFSVKDQRDVKSFHNFFLWHFTEAHVEEVLGEAESRVGGDAGEALAAPEVVGDDRGEFGENRFGLGAAAT